jgi:hypothetical protein
MHNSSASIPHVLQKGICWHCFCLQGQTASCPNGIWCAPHNAHTPTPPQQQQQTQQQQQHQGS